VGGVVNRSRPTPDPASQAKVSADVGSVLVGTSTKCARPASSDACSARAKQVSARDRSDHLGLHSRGVAAFTRLIRERVARLSYRSVRGSPKWGKTLVSVNGVGLVVADSRRNVDDHHARAAVDVLGLAVAGIDDDLEHSDRRGLEQYPALPGRGDGPSSSAGQGR
jgi:hypothetical protein